MTLTDIVFWVAVLGSTIGLVTLSSAFWWWISRPPVVLDDRPAQRIDVPGWRIVPRRPYDWSLDGD